ncbi:hypothetical protein B0H12DRAFT_1120945 [Mycena haematopus]|nr:hypothetical protein B0H12DRAFT_1120945 [Mycena haematopus]
MMKRVKYNLFCICRRMNIRRRFCVCLSGAGTVVNVVEERAKAVRDVGAEQFGREAGSTRERRCRCGVVGRGGRAGEVYSYTARRRTHLHMVLAGCFLLPPSPSAIASNYTRGSASVECRESAALGRVWRSSRALGGTLGGKALCEKGIGREGPWAWWW